MTTEYTDVVICGAGPTGMMLSAYLGRAGVSNIVLEREPGITNDPRGIGMDEDGMRLLQGIGLYDQLFTSIGSCFGKFCFIGGKTKSLAAKPFLVMDFNTSEGGTGHPGFMSHKQPCIEKALRDAATSTSKSELRVESTVTGIKEDSQNVFVEYTDRDGIPREIKSKFMVGADGKTGFTRKKYLEQKGVKMEQASSMGYEEVWVALNWKINLPNRKTHPDFPLWPLGYTPEDVFDAFFPKDFRFLCNPVRSAVCGSFGPSEDRLWRFEFVVREDEDGWKMAEPDNVRKIVYPYITHPGKRYGLSEDVQFPEDCIETLRSRPFKFSARSCNKWAVDRVMLVGDAAHVFPPFGGQGIASGFRDANALSWRLALACRPNFTGDHSALLRAWYLERKQQLDKSLRATVLNGSYCTERDQTKIFLRDLYLWMIQLVPRWRRMLEMGPRVEGLPVYKPMDDFALPFLPALCGGRHLPQVYCRKLDNTEPKGTAFVSAPITFTDDAIYGKSKKGFFQIIALLDKVDDLEEAVNDLGDVELLSDGEILKKEITFIVQDINAVLDAGCPEVADGNVYRIATGDEFAADIVICHNRPAPKYYDEHRMRKDMDGAKYLIVRPDRFVFAACHTKGQLDQALKEIPVALGLE